MRSVLGCSDLAQLDLVSHCYIVIFITDTGKTKRCNGLISITLLHGVSLKGEIGNTEIEIGNKGKEITQNLPPEPSL